MSGPIRVDSSAPNPLDTTNPGGEEPKWKPINSTCSCNSSISSIKIESKKTRWERFKDFLREFKKELPSYIKSFLKQLLMINIAIYLPRLIFFRAPAALKAIFEVIKK